MIELWEDGELMTEWDPNSCKAHVYAEEIVNLTKKLVPKNSNILMLGLGGGAIGAKLCDIYNVTVLEINESIIKKAKSLFFPHFKLCGMSPQNMEIICGDAFNPPHEKLKLFDAIIEDIPPCYQGKTSIPIRVCSKFVKQDGFFIGNFHSLQYTLKIMDEIKDLWKINSLSKQEHNFICTAKLVQIWPAIKNIKKMNSIKTNNIVNHDTNCFETSLY